MSILCQRSIIALAVLSFIACFACPGHAFSLSPQLGKISTLHSQHSRFCRQGLLNRGHQSPRMTLSQETPEWQTDIVKFGQLSSVLAAVMFCAPHLTDAASPDLSHSPLANKQVNMVIEGYPRIVDGDTLVFQEKSGQKEKVRLLGIDAPESKQICINQGGKEYLCGVESKAYLETIIGKDPVQCLAAKRDQYARVLGVCFDEKTGKELNEAMVKNGEALAYVQFSKAYVGGEAEAMNGHKGLWQGKFQKPWEYRKAKRMQGAEKNEVKKEGGSVNYVISENKKIKMPKTEFEMPEEFLDDAE